MQDIWVTLYLCVGCAKSPYYIALTGVSGGGHTAQASRTRRLVQWPSCTHTTEVRCCSAVASGLNAALTCQSTTSAEVVKDKEKQKKTRQMTTIS